MVWSRWRPWDDVVVDTVLAGGAPWHHRMHLIRTARALTATDTGFAVGVESLGLGADVEHGEGYAVIRAGGAVSGIVSDHGVGSARTLPPNANIVEPAAAMPALGVDLVPGEHLVSCSVLGSTDARAWDEPPSVPDAAQILLEVCRGRVTDAPTTDPALGALARRRLDGNR